MMGNHVGDRLDTMPHPTTCTLARGFCDRMVPMTNDLTNRSNIVTINDAQLVTGHIHLRIRLLRHPLPISVDIGEKPANS